MTDDRPTSTDFLEWYRYWARPGTAPECFQRWVALSVLSAAIQDRIQVARDAVRRSTLGLYVLLIGPSGIGKGEAITRQGLVLAESIRQYINPVVGKISTPFLISYMAGTFKAKGKAKASASNWVPRKWGHCWLVCEELAANLRVGEAAAQALADLTDLWGKNSHVCGTRNSGYVQVGDMHLTCILGTTPTWLRSVFPATAVDSGTLPRFCVVVAPPDTPKPIRPTYPDDWPTIDQWMKDWILAYAQVGWEAPVILEWDEEARAEVDGYVTAFQAALPQRTMAPFLQRTQELIEKLAGLLTAAGWPITYAVGSVPTLAVPDDPRISVYAVRRAATYYWEMLSGVPGIMATLKATPWTLETEQVLQIMQDTPHALPRTWLVKECRNRGMTEIAVEKALRALFASGEVECHPAPYRRDRRDTILWWVGLTTGDGRGDVSTAPDRSPSSPY